MILNIGCGDDPYGDVRLDLFQTKATNALGDAANLPFADGVFSDIYERNLLEHMPNPAAHLQEVRRVLKKGGILRLVTDNAACLKYYTLGTHTGGYRKHGGKDLHFALFTKEHIRNLMDFVGFSVKEIKLLDTDYPTRHFDRLLRLVKPELSYPRIWVEATKR